MSKPRLWIRNWLTDPPLGQHFRIRPGDPAAKQPESTFQSTKQLLKEHMVDTFFERALHQIETPASQSAQPIHAGDSPAHHISPFSYDDEEEDPFSAPEEDLNSGESYDLDAAAPEEDYVSQTLAEVIDLNDFAIAEPSLESPKAEVGYYVFAITLDQYDYDVPEDQIAGNYPLFVYGFNRIRAVLPRCRWMSTEKQRSNPGSMILPGLNILSRNTIPSCRRFNLSYLWFQCGFVQSATQRNHLRHS